MAKLVIVLCLACFGAYVNAAPVDGFGGFGGFSTASAETLAQLQPKLVTAVDTWAASHDFPYKFSRIVSGSSQPVAGTIYELTSELKDQRGNTIEMHTRVLENLKGDVEKITFTLPGNEYVLTF